MIRLYPVCTGPAICSRMILMKEIFTENFFHALKDYCLFTAKGYPESSLRSLVGDRHRLNAYQRSVLYRGIMPPSLAKSRRGRTVSSIKGKTVIIDGFNVLFTLANCILGRPAYIARDGFLRDTGEHFSLPFGGSRTGAFKKSADLLFRHLAEKNSASAVIILDETADIAGAAESCLQEVLRQTGTPRAAAAVILAPSADKALAAIRDGIIATGDSGIIDRSRVPVYDAALR
ncbi:MAG: DUF434 domain-containing protein, partial [Spirochaetales bacterium]